MADMGTLTFTVGTATGINVVYNIRNNVDPFPGLLASGILYGSLVLIGEGLSYELATAFAVLFLLVTFLMRGEPFINFINDFVSSDGRKVGRLQK